MFGILTPEIDLSGDWINGIVANPNTRIAVDKARNALKGSDHESVKSLWKTIERKFAEWKEQQTYLPRLSNNPLEVNQAIDYERARSEYFEHVTKDPKDLIIFYAVAILEAASRGDELALSYRFQKLAHYREYAELKDTMRTNEMSLNYIQDLEHKLRKGKKEGGEYSGQLMKKIGADNREVVFESAKKFIDKVPKRNLIGSIMRDTNLTRNTVDKHLKKLREAGELPPKKTS